MSKKKLPQAPNISLSPRGLPVCSKCKHNAHAVPEHLRDQCGGAAIICTNQLCDMSPVKAIKCNNDTLEIRVSPNSHSDNHKWLMLVRHEYIPNALRECFFRGNKRGAGELLRSSHNIKKFMSSRKKSAEFIKWGFQRSSSRNSFLRDIRKFVFGVKFRHGPIIVRDSIHYM